MKKGQLDSHILVLVTLGLTAFGLVMVYSATSAPAALGGGDPVFYLKRESIYAAIGVVLLMVGSRMDYRALRYFAPVLMLTSLALCAAVLVVGQEVNGARRWLGVGLAELPALGAREAEPRDLGRRLPRAATGAEDARRSSGGRSGSRRASLPGSSCSSPTWEP